MANEVGYDVQADIEKQEYAKWLNKILLKQHMRITLKSRWYFNQYIAKHPKAKYPGLADEVAELKCIRRINKIDVLALEQKMQLKLLCKAAELLQKNELVNL
jgi:hypothetical protein